MTSKSVHSSNVLTRLVLRIKDHKILNQRTGFLYFAFVLIYSLLESVFKINKVRISYIKVFLVKQPHHKLLTIIMFHFPLDQFRLVIDVHSFIFRASSW